MNFGLVKTFDHLPRPHSIELPFYCGYVLRIPDLRIEKDLPKREALTRLVSLRNQCLLAIADLMPYYVLKSGDDIQIRTLARGVTRLKFLQLYC
jgi:hypothetical protein